MPIFRVDAVSDLRTALRNIRMERDLSQADLARSAGVSRKWIIELETGSRSVRLDTLLALLNALDLRLAIEQDPERPLDLDSHLDDMLNS